MTLQELREQFERVMVSRGWNPANFKRSIERYDSFVIRDFWHGYLYAALENGIISEIEASPEFS